MVQVDGGQDDYLSVLIMTLIVCETTVRHLLSHVMKEQFRAACYLPKKHMKRI